MASRSSGLESPGFCSVMSFPASPSQILMVAGGGGDLRALSVSHSCV